MIRDFKWDKPKSITQLKSDFGKICMIPKCGKPLTSMQGPGSGVLCREHQIYQREYGGMGRIDRPHTFHRTWVCSECGYNPLEDPRISCIEDLVEKYRVARITMHGDHGTSRRADGGDDSQENIVSLCYVCHAKKTILNKDYLKSKKKLVDKSVNQYTITDVENKSVEVIDSNLAIDIILNDKLDSTGVKLLSNSQDRLIKNLKENDEK